MDSKVDSKKGKWLKTLDRRLRVAHSLSSAEAVNLKHATNKTATVRVDLITKFFRHAAGTAA